MQNDFYLFICFVICINVLYPMILIVIFYYFDALGSYDSYCWIKDGDTKFMIVLYVLKFINILLNFLMTVRMLFKVNQMDKNKEENRKEITFCKKTIVFPIIQIVLNVTMTVFKVQHDYIYIGNYLSSFNGIAYPIYIIIYTEIFKKKKKEEVNDTIKDEIDITNRFS